MYNEQLFKLFYENGKRLEVSKGTLLYSSDKEHDCNVCYFLDSGCIALTGLTKSGGERIIIYCQEEHRLVGFLHLMHIKTDLGDTLLPIHIVTKTDCVVYQIREDFFQEQLANNPGFVEYIARIQSENYQNIMHRFHMAQDEVATVRLCDLLLNYSREESGLIMVPAFFNYAELSRYLGIHVVTVSRIMVRLREQGFIEKHGHRIILQNIEGIKELINSQSNFDF